MIFNCPVFIIGQGRSGTSILLEAISHHPKIPLVSGKQESPVIARFGDIIYNQYLTDQSKYYSDCNKIYRNGFKNNIKKIIFKTVFGRVYPQLFWYNFQGYKYWITKTFPTFQQYKGLKEIYPQSKFLYIVRNPVEQINSATKFPGFLGKEFEFYCKEWVRYTEQYKYCSDQSDCFIINYNELIRNPKVVFENVFKFLELEYSSKPLNLFLHKVIHPTTFSVQIKDESQRVNQILDSWDEYKINIFKAVCSERALEMGFYIPK